MSYHKQVATCLQCAKADAEQYHCREGVVVNESSTVSITMAPIQGQVSVSVAREKHRAEVNLQSDGLYSTVHADVPLSYRKKSSFHHFNAVSAKMKLISGSVDLIELDVMYPFIIRYL